MTTIKLIPIGNSTGSIFPKEVLAKLRAEKGDSLYLTEIPGGYALRAYDEDFAGQMEKAEQVMHQYRDTLRKLAE